MPSFWGYPPPPPHDYPFYWVILDPKSKEDKFKVSNLQNLPKFQMFEFLNKCDTRHTFWSCLIRCANMKWIQWALLKIQSGHDSVHRWTDGQTDRRTDGQTDKVKPVNHPFNFVEVGGIINLHVKAQCSGHHFPANIFKCISVNVEYFGSDITALCSQEYNWEHSIDLGNDLALKKSQAMSWASVDQIIWCCMGSPGLNQLIRFAIF